MRHALSVKLCGIACLATAGLLAACQQVHEAAHDVTTVFEDTPTYQAEVEEGIGAAIAILVDTSGSMEESVPGGSEGKYVVAQRALGRVMEVTDKFTKDRPDFPIKVTLWGFSSTPIQVLPIDTFDMAEFDRALQRIPHPGGGTAIGEAMMRARPELYRAGTYRKYMIVVTDGQNTSGRFPEPVSREIYRKSEGVVQIYFVAFDINPATFGFVKEVGGDVVAAESAEQLQTALKDIYEGKILAEVDYGETLPGDAGAIQGSTP